jgi:ABC-2 type transport system permease protein
VIAAILRAQWLTMRFGGRGRGLTIIVGLIWYGIWAVAAVATGLAVAESDLSRLRFTLPLGLLGIFAYWQLMPVLSASMGSALDLRKLLAYPIPHRKLFAVEVLLRFTTALEMVLVLLGGVAGLLANHAAGGWRGAGRILLALPLFVAINLLLASGTRSLFERFLSRRHVREVVVLLTTMLWVLPRVAMSMGYGGQSLRRLASVLQTVVLPWTAAANAAIGQTQFLAIASLFGWALLAGWFGRAQFERSLRYDAQAAQASAAQEGGARLAIAEWFYRFPSLLWRDPLAAVVEKELRSLARTPRFRTVFIMGFTFGLAVWFPFVASRHSDGGPASGGSSWFLTAVCVYALTLLGQVSYWNCFGFDRAASAFYFAAPLPLSRVIVGKNIASLIYIYLEVLMVIAVTSILRISGGLEQAIETLAVMGVCASYMLALGNLGSVHYPRALSGDRVSQGGGRGFQGFLFLIYPVALLPVVLAYVARYAFDSNVMFTLVLALAAIIGGVLYWIALESAVHAGVRRREQIVQALSEGDGPVTGE